MRLIKSTKEMSVGREQVQRGNLRILNLRDPAEGTEEPSVRLDTLVV